MMCPDCKRQNPPDAVYCENCGAELQAAGGAHAKRATRIEGVSAPARTPSDPGQEFWRPPNAGGAAPKRATMMEPGAAPSGPPDPFKPRDPFAVSAVGQVAQVPPQTPFPQPTGKRSTMYDPGAQQAPAPSADPFKAAVAPVAAPSASVGPYTLGARAQGLKLIGWLVTFDNAPDGFSFPLTEGRNSIGREEDRDLRIDEGKVSGRHCCIQHRSNPDGTSRTWVFDENSTNGTVLNGNDIFTDRPEVKDGDLLKIGSATFLVKLIDQARAAQLWPKKAQA